MLVGLLTRRVPALAAKVALVVGFTVIAMGYFVPRLSLYVDRLHEFHFLGVVFAGLVGLMLVIGRMAPREQPFVQRDAGAVDLTPWQWAWPMGLLLVLVVLSMYVSLADVSILGTPAAAAVTGPR